MNIVSFNHHRFAKRQQLLISDCIFLLNFCSTWESSLFLLVILLILHSCIICPQLVYNLLILIVYFLHFSNLLILLMMPLKQSFSINILTLWVISKQTRNWAYKAVLLSILYRMRKLILRALSICPLCLSIICSIFILNLFILVLKESILLNLLEILGNILKTEQMISYINWSWWLLLRNSLLLNLKSRIDYLIY